MMKSHLLLLIVLVCSQGLSGADKYKSPTVPAKKKCVVEAPLANFKMTRNKENTIEVVAEGSYNFDGDCEFSSLTVEFMKKDKNDTWVTAGPITEFATEKQVPIPPKWTVYATIRDLPNGTALKVVALLKVKVPATDNKKEAEFQTAEGESEAAVPDRK
jgi:hypothetical protein